MRAFIPLVVLALAIAGASAAVTCPTISQMETNIIALAQGAMSPDSTQYAFYLSILAEINATLTAPLITGYSFVNATKVDTHTHIVPNFYRTLNPTTGGNPTPSWNVSSSLSFMSANGIRRSLISISAPGANACYNNTAAAPYCMANDTLNSVVLARILNYYLCAVVSRYPQQFDFYAVVPLPYVQQAINEAEYALNTLGAIAVGTLSNHESIYIGDPSFAPFFAWLNNTKPSQHEVVFVHPNSPCEHVGGLYVTADPTIYAPGLVEFFFEDARAFMSLTTQGTLNTYTNINYLVPHSGGSFASIIERFFTILPPAVQAASLQAYMTRLWWDSAGPSYPNAAYALLGYGIPPSQFVFGTDFPYAPAATLPATIQAVYNTSWLTTPQKTALFSTNVEALFLGIATV
jgi:hypothetical protein